LDGREDPLVGPVSHPDRDAQEGREDHETFRRLTAPHLGDFEVLHNRSGMLAFMGWTKAAAWVSAERNRRHIRMAWGEKALSEGRFAIAQGRYAEGVAILDALIDGRTWGSNRSLAGYEAAAIGKHALGDLAGAVALLGRAGAAPAAAVMYQSDVHWWLRCRVLLAEFYRDSGRTAEARAVAREVQQWTNASGPLSAPCDDTPTANATIRSTPRNVIAALISASSLARFISDLTNSVQTEQVSQVRAWASAHYLYGSRQK
jgi:hypothetical protein